MNLGMKWMKWTNPIHLREEEEKWEELSDDEETSPDASPTPNVVRRSRRWAPSHQSLRRWWMGMLTHPRRGSRSLDTVKWVGGDNWSMSMRVAKVGVGVKGG